MTGFLWIGVIVALAVPLACHGSYAALILDTRWEWATLLAGGVALVLASGHISAEGGFDIGFGALVAGYVLLLAFCGRNVVRTGMTVVLIGLAANALAITVNHGMPVRVEPRWAAHVDAGPTVLQHPGDASTHLYWITDVIYVPPIHEVISFGDLIIAVGLIDVTFQASRRRRQTDAGEFDEDDLADTAQFEVVPAGPDDLVRVLPRTEASSRAAPHGALERIDDGAHPPVGVPRS
ncbi:MAG TPA: DUF5317 family protein [Acidimicrobiia bacterium]